MSMSQFKYIAELSEEELIKEIVIPATNEQGYQCILIKNSVMKTIFREYNTDNLEIRLNSVLRNNDTEFYFHIIRAKETDYAIKLQFQIIYEYVFNKITNPISDNELLSLVTSLEEFFRITPDVNPHLLQIGVYGELLTIQNLYINGYREITQKYHKNFYSTHDIEISPELRIEIKTSTNEKRIHHFSHNQISRTDTEVYVVSSVLEESQEGKSLFTLFDEVKLLYDDAEAVFELEKLKKRCNVSESNEGIRIAYNKAINDLRIINAHELPQINSLIPQGVTGVNYDVECGFANYKTVNDFVSDLLNS